MGDFGSERFVERNDVHGVHEGNRCRCERVQHVADQSTGCRHFSADHVHQVCTIMYKNKINKPERASYQI